MRLGLLLQLTTHLLNGKEGSNYDQIPTTPNVANVHLAQTEKRQTINLCLYLIAWADIWSSSSSCSSSSSSVATDMGGGEELSGKISFTEGLVLYVHTYYTDSSE
jgi:hypothetical protein